MLFLAYRKEFRYFIVTRLKRYMSSLSSEMKVFTQKKNPITGSTEWGVQHEDYDFHQEIARSAFADMLHDKERNKKYQRALQLAIDKMHNDGKKANVLDIGTGTGLLSIMAARCGADSVVACEAFKPMANCCLKILERNGVADKIKVIPKRSTDLKVGEDGDMSEKANILVTEVFDTELIGEGAISTFSHAHKYLLEKDCIVVPDSAVVYAQVVECPTLNKWNTVNGLVDDDLQVILKIPPKIADCPGTAAIHDIQLSQLPRHAFRELSEQIPVFYYDWSGKTPIDKKKTVKQQFKVTNTGQAQIVFMWWELNMDTEGKICLSTAPWWGHPDVDSSAARPQDTIPWRDHWMQGVYFFPKVVTVTKDTEVTLVCCQDEYSLWFYLEDGNIKYKHYKRPVCECGIHITLSRTHIAYLNDGKRSKRFLNQIKEEISKDSVVLDVNGSSLQGLAAAKIAKTVYVLENVNICIEILTDYMKENGIKNVIFLFELDLTDKILKQVTNVICDPYLSTSILPWENLKIAYILYKYRNSLKDVSVIPESCEFWAMPVEFQDLHKIRIPLENCEGIDMSIFDELVEHSRLISDSEIEAQPLWEYPGKCQGEPRKVLHIDLRNLKQTYANDHTHKFSDTDTEQSLNVNAFAIWAVWTVGGKPISTGPIELPAIGDLVEWDPHTRQAVKILQYSRSVTTSEYWNHQVTCDIEKGQFDLNIDFVKE